MSAYFRPLLQSGHSASHPEWTLARLGRFVNERPLLGYRGPKADRQLSTQTDVRTAGGGFMIERPLTNDRGPKADW